MNRSKIYDEKLSKQLQKPRYARSFLLNLMDGQHGLSIEEALKQTIECMGIKEFSKLSKISPPSISRTLKGNSKPTTRTLDLFLKPFELKIKLIVEKIK